MKFLSNSFIMLFFLVNTEIVIGQTDHYTKVFEEEVSSNYCRNIICQIKNYGSQRAPLVYEAPVATGYSTGPLGTITHYENRTFHSSYETPSDWRCIKCGERYYFSTPKSPIVHFHNNVRDERIMEIDTCGAGSPHFCMGSEYNGLSCTKKEEKEEYMRLLKEIFRKASPKGKGWVTAFKSMWETARSLDNPGLGTLSLFHISNKEKNKEETNEVIRRITHYKIEKNSCCCLIQ